MKQKQYVAEIRQLVVIVARNYRTRLITEPRLYQTESGGFGYFVYLTLLSRVYTQARDPHAVHYNLLWGRVVHSYVGKPYKASSPYTLSLATALPYTVDRLLNARKKEWAS